MTKNNKGLSRIQSIKGATCSLQLGFLLAVTSFFVHHCLCTCEMSDLNNKSTNAITGKSTEAILQELLESISYPKREVVKEIKI